MKRQTHVSRQFTCLVLILAWFVVMAVAVAIAVVWTPRTAAVTLLSPEAGRPLFGAPSRNGARTAYAAAEALGPTVAPRESIPPSARTITGDANQATLSHGRDYLAMRLPRGTVVDICAAKCWNGAVTTDYGPKKSTGDIADIGIVHWRHICQLPDGRGECRVRITIHGHGATPTGPPTDTTP